MRKKSPNPRMAFSKRSREESGVNNEAIYWGGGDKPMIVPGKKISSIENRMLL